jgi:hypothetical protein
VIIVPNVCHRCRLHRRAASLTSVANLAPVSLTPVATVSTTLAKLVEKFASGVVDTGGKFANSAIFEKIRNGPN